MSFIVTPGDEQAVTNDYVPAMAKTLLSLLESAMFRLLMSLPHPLMRLLAGKPVTLDGQVLDTETQWALRLQRLLREPAVESLPIPQGRLAMLRQARLSGGRQPVGEVRDLQVPGGDGPIRARLYIPRSGAGAAGTTSPLLFFIHGGGMMYGDLDSHDATCRLLAERADVRVLAVDYRLSPEHRYPAAVEDCWAAYQWVAEHAEELGADPERLAVGGDSAGGYLSAVVAIKAAEAGVPCTFQLLVYPVTNMADPSGSRTMFADGFYLTKKFIDLADESYLRGPEDRRDPLVSVQFTEKFPSGLAPAFVATAGFDPLRDEGEIYARTMAEHGVQVETKRYPGLIHGFFNIVGVGRSNRAAVAEIAAKLKAAVH
jgi:acetyl esterase